MRVDGIEARHPGSVLVPAAAQLIEFLGGRALERGKGVNQTPIGAIGHLGIAPEMLHRLAHGAPPGLFVAVPLDHAQNLEFPGVVDVDPQHILVIVELDRVGFEPELSLWAAS